MQGRQKQIKNTEVNLYPMLSQCALRLAESLLFQTFEANHDERATNIQELHARLKSKFETPQDVLSKAEDWLEEDASVTYCSDNTSDASEFASEFDEVVHTPMLILPRYLALRGCRIRRAVYGRSIVDCAEPVPPASFHEVYIFESCMQGTILGLQLSVKS
jgi:hypothetical protein